jgi:glycosyltransferase involved in cell wall biosynthesis
MNLLVFAHPPPPVHGQSVMVQQLLKRLPHEPGFTVWHVDSRVSRDAADIGRARPGKRAALYRDFVVLLLCRPFFSGLILHWHAVGLGEWLDTHARPWERWLAQRLLGRAALALVLSPALAADARQLRPRHVAIVPNGLPDPAPAFVARPSTPETIRVLYLGLCSREKGAFDLIAAVTALAQRSPGRFHLTLAGGAASPEDERDLRTALAALPAGAAT